MIEPSLLPDADRPRIRREVAIVLGLSLGQSAVYAIVQIIARLTAPQKLSSQTATLNSSASDRSLLDLTYQILQIGFALVPVVLALYLLSSNSVSASRLLGFDWRGGRGALRDLMQGVTLAAVIGIPGLAFYYLALAVGINAQVVPTALNTHWWTLPVLILAAIQNAILEEVIVVGYLFTRLRQLGVSRWGTYAISSVLRGSYHLYQGFGGFLGNIVMGLVFCWWFERRGRTMPLIVAHSILDIVAFVGYALFKSVLPA